MFIVTHYAVWGFGSTGSEVGVLSEHSNYEEAAEAVKKWLQSQDNSAVGAWVRNSEVQQ